MTLNNNNKLKKKKKGILITKIEDLDWLGRLYKCESNIFTPSHALPITSPNICVFWFFFFKGINYQLSKSKWAKCVLLIFLSHLTKNIYIYIYIFVICIFNGSKYFNIFVICIFNVLEYLVKMTLNSRLNNNKASIWM